MYTYATSHFHRDIYKWNCTTQDRWTVKRVCQKQATSHTRVATSISTVPVHLHLLLLLYSLFILNIGFESLNWFPNLQRLHTHLHSLTVESIKCPQWRYCTYVRTYIYTCCKLLEGTVSTEGHTYTRKHFPPIYKCKQLSLKYVQTLTNATDMQTSLQGLQPYNALEGLAQAHPNYTNATIVWHFIRPHLCPYSPMKPTIGLP